MSISLETLNNLYNQGIINYVPYELCNVPAIAPMNGSPMDSYPISGMGAYSQAPVNGGYNYGYNSGYGNLNGNFDVSMYKNSPAVIGGAGNVYARNGYNRPIGVNTTVTVPQGGYYVQNGTGGYADSPASYYGHDSYVKRSPAPENTKSGFFRRLKAKRQNNMNGRNNVQQGYVNSDIYEKYNPDSPEYSDDKSKLKAFWQKNSAILRGLISLGILITGGIIFCKKVKKPKKIKP